MRLLFIYGPPASGKFTVGSELAQRTGYKFFHNQITVPVARALFPDAHEPHQGEGYSNLLKELRQSVIRVAAEENIDVIFTLAYSGAVDDAFVEHIVQAVKDTGGDVHFIQLDAPDGILVERVSNSSRRQLAKLAEPRRLKQVLETRDMRATVKWPDVLHVNTAMVSPAEACDRIVEFFGLEGVVRHE